jgi:hypothetical protein
MINSCASVSGEASFSRIRITDLASSCSLNTKYGELRLNGISRNFRTVYVKSEYTDIYLGINSASSYSLDLTYDAKTSLNIVSPVNNQLKKETLDAKQGIVQATGTVGKTANSAVTVSAKAGSLSLINK